MAALTNRQIAQLLRNVGAALEIKGENRFRIIAYDKAATSIEHLTSEVKDLWDEGKLEGIPGIGPTIARHLDELFKTGKVAHFENVFDGLSPAIFELLLVPGIGPKKAYRLTQEFHITDPKTAVTQLKKVAKTGRIAKLEGFGEKSQADILSNIETYKKGQIKENRMPLPYADTLAHEVIDYLQKHPAVKRVDALGSLRRKVATIGDIDLALVTDKPKEVNEYFVKYPKVRKIIDSGEKGSTVLLSVGRQVDLRVQTAKTYGSMLQYFTGSKHHNISLREFALSQGFSLSEHGIKPLGSKRLPEQYARFFNKNNNLYEFSREEDFYESLGLSWMPPEMREDQGEINAAIKHEVPQLVTVSDIRGEMHVHSSYNLEPSHDLGSSSLSELLDQAVNLDYEYLGISDHNPSLGNHSEKEIISIMKKRKDKYEQEYYSWKDRVKKRTQLFISLEVDILPSGKIALPQEAFEFVDAVVVSIHSNFRMEKPAMTERILKALSAHPKIKIFAHPTGRLLGSREGLEADWNQIFAFVASHNQALEINSWPERLDLPDRLVREAVKQGVKLIIDTDAHQATQMKNIEYGVDVARRGWAEKKDILNTLEYNKFKSWLTG